MNTAVVIIDVQAELFDEAPRPDQADQTVDRINALTIRARAAGVPILFVQHETFIGPLAFGSPGWTLERRVAVGEGDHAIRKTTPDSFLRTNLERVLASHRVTRIIVCGYATEFCVDTTVRRAAALGYEVVIAADAHTTHDKAHASATQIRVHHNATLPGITSFGPRIVALNEAAIRFDARRTQNRSLAMATASVHPTTIRPATASDLAPVVALLVAAKLPVVGVAEHFGDFIVAERAGLVVGTIGLEVYGDAGLVRSVVTAPEARGIGIGSSLVEAIEARATVRGVRDLVLLTETAQDWATRFGYERMERSATPSAVAASAGFKGPFPSSLITMGKRLGMAGSAPTLRA